VAQIINLIVAGPRTATSVAFWKCPGGQVDKISKLVPK